jgi:hypothetical protein
MITHSRSIRECDQQALSRVVVGQVHQHVLIVRDYLAIGAQKSKARLCC